MNFARHRINKRKKELGVVKMASALTGEMDCPSCLSIWQHLWASNMTFPLSFLLHFIPCPILCTLPTIQEMDFIHLCTRHSIQMSPDPLRLSIPGQSKTKIHIVMSHLWVCMMTIIRMGKIRLRLLLVLNYFSCKTLVSPPCDKLLYNFKKPELSHDCSLK